MADRLMNIQLQKKVLPSTAILCQRIKSASQESTPEIVDPP